MGKKKEKSQTVAILRQFTVLLLQCAMERPHPSIHPVLFHTADIPLLPRKIAYDRFRKFCVSDVKYRGKAWVNDWWDSGGIRVTPGDASQLCELASPGAELPIETSPRHRKGPVPSLTQ